MVRGGKHGKRVRWKCEREGGGPRAPREMYSAAAMRYEIGQNSGHIRASANNTITLQHEGRAA